MVAIKIYSKGKHEFTIPEIKKRTGICEFAARKRLRAWVAGKITLKKLLEPKNKKGRGSLDTLAPTKEELKILNSIPGPTNLERKYL